MVRFETGVGNCRRVVTSERFFGLAGLLFFAFSLIPVPAHSQAWSGILDTSRATDWTKAGIPGGIPNRTTVCATVSPSNDTTGATDTITINNAIHGCGSNQVVQLSAGTFYSNGITFGIPAVNNVTLRGAGPDKTTIIGLGLLSCGQWGYICIKGNPGWAKGYPRGASTAWTGGYSQGTNVITVGSSAGLSTTLDRKSVV